MLPLPTMSTPWLRSSRSCCPRKQVLDRCAAVVHAELHDGDVGIGEHGFQHGPSAVVQAPFVHIDADKAFGNGRNKLLAQLLSHRRRARCGVLLGEELLREAAKIVNRFRVLHAREPPATGDPVCGDAQNQAGRGVFFAFAEFFAQGLPAAAVGVVFNRVHRAAVANEHDGHFGGAFEGFHRSFRRYYSGGVRIERELTQN